MCKLLPFSQYSDLAEAERASILEKFRQATTRWNQIASCLSGDDNEIEKEEKSHLVVVTDACLPLLASGESPIAARVLINYELPAKKVGLKSSFSCICTSNSCIRCYDLIFFVLFFLAYQTSQAS